MLFRSYKAAFYDPTKSGTGGYWKFATQSDTAPGNVVGGSANQANYTVGGLYSVTQSSNGSGLNLLSDVGAFTNSASYYGTFDQSGNVDEWTDARSVRGGGYSMFRPRKRA